MQPAPQAAYAKLLPAGWTDALRTLHPDDPMLHSGAIRGTGGPGIRALRLDHLLLSPAARRDWRLPVLIGTSVARPKRETMLVLYRIEVASKGRP